MYLNWAMDGITAGQRENMTASGVFCVFWILGLFLSFFLTLLAVLMFFEEQTAEKRGERKTGHPIMIYPPLHPYITKDLLLVICRIP